MPYYHIRVTSTSGHDDDGIFAEVNAWDGMNPNQRDAKMIVYMNRTKDRHGPGASRYIFSWETFEIVDEVPPQGELIT